ncbi:MAG: dTDP-4-dehydrorhamnose 3,5-epimerase [Betaproteobacteria bacterium]|nr:MAG: dTDP-4-dehydrorhamnose 3,5-epimerase [Betaproteobacteria bacterium]
MMNVILTAIADCAIIEPRVFKDDRGEFYESFNEKRFSELVDSSVRFVQDNQSTSHHGVLRGLHYQTEQAQGKLVRVIHGEVFDVAVDLRRSSKSFGQWVGVNLSAENQRMFWVPAGFAHGFVVLSESATFLYKATDYYAPQFERTLAWNDPTIGIEWPLASPNVSAKDAVGKTLSDADTYA